MRGKKIKRKLEILNAQLLKFNQQLETSRKAAEDANQAKSVFFGHHES